MKQDSAFSGLEAAIVLIAFVVVAAVFSYVMLGAGFFATQKSQEVTYSGIKQSTSNIVIDGSQYGKMSDGKLYQVTFYLAIPQGGQPQKLSEIDYTVTVDNSRLYRGTSGFEVTPDSTYSSVGYILKAGQSASMLLQFGTAGTVRGPAPGGAFTLEVRPSVGAASILSKQLVTGYKGGVII